MFRLIVVRDVLSVGDDYCFVLEKDGTVICHDVIDAIIESNENIGVIMILKDGQTWSKKRLVRVYI